MRAFVCTTYGAPALLSIEDRPDPTPGPGEVLLETEAVGLGYVDALFVAGTYQVKLPLPFIPAARSPDASSPWAPERRPISSAGGSWRWRRAAPWRNA
jgi:hypothetical protein